MICAAEEVVRLEEEDELSRDVIEELCDLGHVGEGIDLHVVHLGREGGKGRERERDGEREGGKERERDGRGEGWCYVGEIHNSYTCNEQNYT